MTAAGGNGIFVWLGVCVCIWFQDAPCNWGLEVVGTGLVREARTPPSIERCAEINVRDKLASLGEQCDSQDSGGYKMGARLPLLARR